MRRESKETNSKDKNSIMKTVLFYLSLVPYGVFFVWGVIRFFMEGVKRGNWDLYEFIQPLADLWPDIIMNPFGIAACVFALGYPIYYFLDKTGKRKKLQGDDKAEGKAEKSFVLYIVSFIPYLFLVWSVIFGIDFGFFYSATYYGFEALVIALAVGSLIPVYPIVLIFQIVYTVKRHKRLSKKSKRLVKGIVITLLTLLLIPSLIYWATKKHEVKKIDEADRIVIERYLKETYGEQHYQEMEILEKDYVSTLYYIRTPLLNGDLFSVQLDESRTKIIIDDFEESFIREKQLSERMSKRLAKEYGLPATIELNVKVKSITPDVKNYDESFVTDSLLDDCEYDISSIEIHTESLEKAAVTQLLSEFYASYSELLEEHYSGERVVFQLQTAGAGFFRVDMVKPSPDKNYLTIIFWSLDNEEIYIDLSDEENRNEE